MKPRLAAFLGGILALPTIALGQPAEDPDWPCIQRKVPELSPVTVWSGPPIDEGLTRWSQDPTVAELVRKVAPRRVTLQEAEGEIAQFAEALKPDEKAGRLTLVFAGLFETLGRERAEVMAGIDRYGRRQKLMAESIRTEAGRVSGLRASSADPAEVTRANEDLVWQTRIFNERRQSLTFVCEVPTLIEQRLFALARALQRALPSTN